MDGAAQMGRGVSSLIWAGVLALGCGCSMMQKTESTDPRAELMAAQSAAPAGAPTAKYTVELHYDEKQPERVERSLTGPVTVQQAITETGAHKKFKRFTIDVMRQMPGGGTHKLAVEYDTKAKRVVPEFDYALQPGDRVMLREDKTSPVTTMLNDAMGPFGLQKGDVRGRTKSGGFFRVEG